MKVKNKITYLSGGIGGAKFAKGLYEVYKKDLAIIVNTGDDEFIHGVYLCPDIDSVIYGLAEIEGEFGWGIKDDKFTVNSHLNEFYDIDFKIGDRDLATNLFRSQLLNEGSDLIEITSLLSKQFELNCKILPMTNNLVQTKLYTKNGKKLNFQDYFVKKKAKPRLSKVGYVGSKKALVPNEVINSIRNSELVIVGPSNPILSIGPILSLSKIRNELLNHPKVYLISPFIGKSAIKGPSVKNFLDMGFSQDLKGLKKFYKDLVDVFIVQHGDGDRTNNVVEENILFRSKSDSVDLVKKIQTYE